MRTSSTLLRVPGPPSLARAADSIHAKCQPDYLQDAFLEFRHEGPVSVPPGEPNRDLRRDRLRVGARSSACTQRRGGREQGTVELVTRDEIPAACRVAVAVGVVGLLGVLLGCTSDDGAGDGGIPNGFDVADGSRQIGPAIPHGVTHYFKGEPVLDSGFAVVLAVTGDPLEVMNAYVDQARELGLTDVMPKPDAGDGETGDLHCGDGGDRTDDVFTCWMSARTPDRQDPRIMVLAFGCGSVDGSQPFSHLTMKYWTTETNWEHAGVSAVGDELAVPPVPDSIDPPPNDRTMFDKWGPGEPVAVEDGSTLMAELPGHACTAWMPEALLEVSGEPRDVLRRYVEQLEGLIQLDSSDILEPIDVEGRAAHRRNRRRARGHVIRRHLVRERRQRELDPAHLLLRLRAPLTRPPPPRRCAPPKRVLRIQQFGGWSSGRSSPPP